MEPFGDEWEREWMDHSLGSPAFSVADAHADWHANNGPGICPWDCLANDQDDDEE